jgi:hypothetical protein
VTSSSALSALIASRVSGAQQTVITEMHGAIVKAVKPV